MNKITLKAACFISAITQGSRWTLLLLFASDWECNIFARVGINWLEIDANLWRSVFTSVRYAIVSAATTRSSQVWSFLQRTTFKQINNFYISLFHKATFQRKYIVTQISSKNLNWIFIYFFKDFLESRQVFCLCPLPFFLFVISSIKLSIAFFFHIIEMFGLSIAGVPLFSYSCPVNPCWFGWWCFSCSHLSIFPCFIFDPTELASMLDC